MTTAIDLFAGAGGFTVGAERAGLDVILAANHWQAAVDVHSANHPGTQHRCQDLRQMDFEALPDFDVLLASPACQGHSYAGRTPSANADVKHEADRNTALAVIECADKKRPRRILVENVAQFARWELFDWWCDGLRILGYDVTQTIVDAADLGVPQNRKRIIVAASLDGPVEFLPADLAHRPVTDVLLDIDKGWAPVSGKPVGVQARVARGRERLGGRFLTQHVTNHPGRDLARPIGTVTTASQHWHLVDGPMIRPLSIAELAAAQGLPAGYELPSQVTLATRLVGNAIPPAMAEWAVRSAA